MVAVAGKERKEGEGVSSTSLRPPIGTLPNSPSSWFFAQPRPWSNSRSLSTATRISKNDFSRGRSKRLCFPRPPDVVAFFLLLPSPPLLHSPNHHPLHASTNHHLYDRGDVQHVSFHFLLVFSPSRGVGNGRTTLAGPGELDVCVLPPRFLLAWIIKSQQLGQRRIPQDARELLGDRGRCFWCRNVQRGSRRGSRSRDQAEGRGGGTGRGRARYPATSFERGPQDR